MPVRLSIGLIVAVGIVGAVWLIGYLGYRLGFAPIVRVPELVGEPGGGLATGTLVVISIPRAVFQAGLASPALLMLAFVMIALPSAALGAAKPATPGAPRPKPGVAVIASSGAVAAMASGAALIWWTASPFRHEMLRPLPLDPTTASVWYANMQAVAGLDVLAVVAAAIWVVLVFRLPIPLWLRSIAASAALFTLVVVTVAMAITSATATQMGTTRSLCTIRGESDRPRIILGSTPQHTATLTVRNGRTYVELHDGGALIVVTGRESIVGYLAQ